MWNVGCNSSDVDFLQCVNDWMITAIAKFRLKLTPRFSRVLYFAVSQNREVAQRVEMRHPLRIFIVIDLEQWNSNLVRRDPGVPLAHLLRKATDKYNFDIFNCSLCSLLQLLGRRVMGFCSA